MIGELIKYSAVSAKVRAMEGKLLTPAQWESLMAAKNLETLRDILRRCPGWDNVETVEPEVGALCRALTRRLHDDCRHLEYFLSKEDGALMETFLRYQEQAEPMTPEEYQKWWATAGKHGSSLRRIVGEEADVLNLVYLLRLRRFPNSAARAKDYLIPIHYQLKDDLIHRLLKAPDDGAVRAILAGTHWRDTFVSLAPGDLERQYRQYMTTFCRRIIASADPSIATVQAFLPLKDMERRRLMSVIGAVGRGLDPHSLI